MSIFNFQRFHKSCHSKLLLKLILFSIVFACVVQQGFAQSYITPKTDSLIQKGIRLSIEQKYGEAVSLFKTIEKTEPNHPAGYFFHAATLQTQMMDYERYDLESQFFSLLEKTIQLAKQDIRRNSQNAWAHFFLGGAYGYQAFYRAKQNKLLEAFKKVTKSVHTLRRAIQIDSTLYDAYLGLGSYLYQKSKLSHSVAWIPFVKDDRRVAIAMLKKGMQKSRYSKYSALNGLCWIFLEQGNYQEGLKLVETGLKQFPESRVFLWCGAKLATKMNRTREAITFYQKILNSFQKENVSSPYNEVICRKNLAILYAQLNNFDKAHAECTAIKRIPLDNDTKKRLKAAFKTIDDTCDFTSQASF